MSGTVSVTCLVFVQVRDFLGLLGRSEIHSSGLAQSHPQKRLVCRGVERSVDDKRADGLGATIGADFVSLCQNY